MAINIKFDLTSNPEPPTIVLAKRNGDKLGQLKVEPKSIELNDKFNDASEISFTLNKYIDGEITNFWDDVVDFKLIYCKEWDMWFEITVELDEETKTIKTVFCKQLGQAELSQINLYNLTINQEGDSNWKEDEKDYKKTILYSPNDASISLLNRILKDKAPHYSIKHVDETIAGIQRMFDFDDISIYDAFMEIAEEIGCLFVFDSNSDKNGKIQRTISVYDLQQNCENPDCKHRGEFIDECPECGNKNIKYGHGIDTTIFITSDELASSGIQLTTDTDSVKNCFKLEAGDDSITATIRNCNPNGTDYIWYFSDDMKSDMSEELKNKINSYDVIYNEYYNNHISNIDTTILNKYNALVEKYNSRYCLNCGHEGYFKDTCPECDSTNIKLQSIPTTIRGYSALMNAYYNTIDLGLYLESGLMPSVEIAETNAEEQAALLTASALSPVAVADIKTVSETTAKNAVLAMAKVIVGSTFEVKVKESKLSNDKKTWTGKLTVTNHSDEEDEADSTEITIDINDDLKTFAQQKIDKALKDEDMDNLSISGLFKEELIATKVDDIYSFSGKFYDELKKYALNPLTSFYDSCNICLTILQEQGVGNEETWADTAEGSESNLYEKLYTPYLNKLRAIEAEIQIRENEVAVIKGAYKEDDDGNKTLDTWGIQHYINKCKETIQDALNFEDYIGTELWLEFCSYRREDKYSNDNYISDGLNNVELFNKAKEFIEVAKDEIYKSAELQHSISTSLKNLLAIKKFRPLVENFSVGNWMRVQIDDKVYKLRLLDYNISYDDFESISVTFSDVTKVKTGITDLQSILSQASSMATSYSSVQRQAEQGEQSKGTIDQWLSSGLNSAQVRIQNNITEDIVLDKNGLLCRSYNDIAETYDPEQFRLTHNIMAYTDDNWETVSTAFGKHDYKYFNDKEELVDGTGYGLSADFVTAGYVTGSQIISGNIYSENYSEADKTGSHLNLKDGTFSFAGGNLIYNGTDLNIFGGINADSGSIGGWQIGKDRLYIKDENFGYSVFQSPAASRASSFAIGITPEDYEDGNFSNAYFRVTRYGNLVLKGKTDGDDTGGGIIYCYDDSNVEPSDSPTAEVQAKLKILTSAQSKVGGTNYSTRLTYIYPNRIYMRLVTLDSSNTNIVKGGSIYLGYNRSDTIKDDNGNRVTGQEGTYFKFTRPIDIGDGGIKGTDGHVSLFRLGDAKVDGVNGATNLYIGVNREYCYNTVRNVYTRGRNLSFYAYGGTTSQTSDGEPIYTGEIRMFGKFARSIFLENSIYLRGMKSGYSNAIGGSDLVGNHAEHSNIIAHVNSDNRVILGHHNNSTTTEIRSPSGSSILFKCNGATVDESRYAVRLTHDTVNDTGFGYFMPNFNTDSGASYTNLGKSDHKWRNVFATNGTIETSDRNLKKDIHLLSEKYIDMFDLLEPVSYKMLEGDRIHTGFIAQDVEKAMNQVGLTSEDFGGLCKDVKTAVDENGKEIAVIDDDGNKVEVYSLRYSEFIALNTAKIKQLEQLVLQLQDEINKLKSN